MLLPNDRAEAYSSNDRVKRGHSVFAPFSLSFDASPTRHLQNSIPHTTIASAGAFTSKTVPIFGLWNEKIDSKQRHLAHGIIAVGAGIRP